MLHLFADGQVVAGGPDFELLALAAGLMALAVMLFLRKDAKPQIVLLLMLGAIGIAIGSFAFSPKPVPAPRDVSVSIVSPAEGDKVPANSPIDVHVIVNGGHLTSSTTSTSSTAGHLHFFVDGRIVSMPSSLQAPVTLKPGSHTIEVEFVTPNHQPFAPPILDQVQVTAH
jgi:hypothetical protein